MADFLDEEAEMSENEGSEEEEVSSPTKKRVVSSDSEEEEEDDEEKIKAEMGGFVVDNDDDDDEGDGDDDDDDGSGDDGDRKKKKKKKREKRKKESEDEDDELDDDDLDLMEENLGVRLNRQKKLKRVKKVVDSDESGEDKPEEEDREAVAKQIFASDDEDGDDIDKDELEDLEKEQDEEGLVPAGERRREQQPDRAADGGDSEDESDPDDFIVDEEGQPIATKKKHKVKHSDAALQEAQDIFGVDFDFNEFEQYADDREEDSESDYDGEEGEEEAAERKRRRKKQQAAKKSIFELYEPSELERGFFTDADHEIRTMDSPERFLLRKTKKMTTQEEQEELKDEELMQEAEWIYKNAFQTPTISVQDPESNAQDPFSFRESSRSTKGPSSIPRIKEALNFMRNNQFEVPFIAFYRKEYVEPDLNINDLWKVYYWDEKWIQLQNRKENLIRLFEKMQSYQADQILADPDKPLDDKLRVLDDDDIARVRDVESPEQLNDVYQHFLLYYGREVPKMQVAEKVKRKQEKKEAKKREKEMERRARNEDNEDGDPEPEAADDEDDEEDDEDLAQAAKTATRRDPYSHCQDYNLDTLAKRFGLTPEQFGENLRDNYARNDVEQYPADPVELGKELVDERGSFNTPEEVLKGARYMVATQIAREPLVRQCVRTTYYERAKICVTPTKKGKQDIDETHPCFPVKYLKNKPVRELANDEFLKMVQAEQEGLLHITMGIDVMDPSNLSTVAASKYVDEVKELYRRDEFSTQVTQWNEQRALAVEKALHQLLYPVMAKELRQKLLQEAKEHVTQVSRKKLYNWIRVAPYQPDQQLDDEDEYNEEKGPGLRALAFCFSARDLKEVAFGAMVDGEGEVSDFIKLKTFCRCNRFGQMDVTWQEEFDEEKAKLKKFILQKKPHVIVCAADGTSGRDTKLVVERFGELVKELEEEKQIPPIGVEMMETNVARVYAASKKAENDYRDYPTFLRIAISVARRMQDPMMEIAQLVNAEEDLYCLNFHPLQHLVDKEEFMESLSLEFINRVNEVGVDMNKSLTHPPTANLLQFVCGLGPRKAQFIIRTLKTNKQRLENRSQLVHICQMGPKVFMNSAGFIKIDTNSLGDSTDSYLEVLDGTRVHPETYEWARKMAVDALEYDDTSEDANPAAAVEEILESPERLKDLDLDAFAVELERQGYGNKSITLYDIRSELNHRYKDLRTTYRSPTPEEIFNLLTGETPETFYIGKLVMVKVTGIARRRPQNGDTDQANPVRNEETGLWQCPFCLRDSFPELSEVWSHFDSNDCPGQAVGVKCRLDNDCFAFLPTKLISDKPVNNPEERVKIGMTIYARITKIDIERFSVDLTARSTDLADANHEWRPRLDDCYDREQEDGEKRAAEEEKKRKAKCNYIRRVIAHPCFHNYTFKDAEKELMEMEQGEAIIRPSSQGADHLTVSWKVTDQPPIIAHIDVKEENKENDFSLGQSLWIGDEAFEDLDEIIARHVQPMAAFSRDMLNHKYYREAEGGNREIMHKLVTEEKKKAPSKIPYFFSASKDFPGKFILSYAPKMKPRHEFMTVTPDGIRFRQQIHHSLNACINWFKEHFKDPIPGGYQGGTPMSLSGRTPVSGGGGGSVRGTPSNHPHPSSSATQQHAYGNTPNNNPSGTPYGGASVPQRTPGAYGASAGQPHFPSAGTPRAQPTPVPAATPLSHPHHHPQSTPGGGGGFHHPRATPAQAGAMPPPAAASASSTRATPAWATPGQQQQQQSSRATPRSGGGGAVNSAATDWSRAAQEWAASRSNNMKRGGGTPRASGGNTPRGGGNTPRGGGNTPRGGTPGGGGGGTPRQEDPRRTPRSPFVGASPRSQGGATPLYDEVG